MRRAALVLLLTVAACTAPAAISAPRPKPSPSVPSPSGSPGLCRTTGGLPDQVCTPGATNPQVTQATIGSTICVRGWTATVRPPVAYTTGLKNSQKVLYGETAIPNAGLEEDHLIPLEVGGAPSDPRNLWPEPRAGYVTAGRAASDKDLVENMLKAQVCAGSMTLVAAQRAIASDWTALRQAAAVWASASPAAALGGGE